MVFLILFLDTEFRKVYSKNTSQIMVLCKETIIVAFAIF